MYSEDSSYSFSDDEFAQPFIEASFESIQQNGSPDLNAQKVREIAASLGMDLGPAAAHAFLAKIFVSDVLEELENPPNTIQGVE